MTHLYAERGISRGWLLIAPIVTAAMIISQAVILDQVRDWWIWLLLGGLAQLFVWMQVSAGRTHVSVALTPEELRCGAESIPVAEIAAILPGKAPDNPRKTDPATHPTWMATRAMGRLRVVPRRRFGLGLQLTDGSQVQAWARNDYALRAALEPLLTARGDGAASS